MTYRRTRKYDASRLEAMARGKQRARLARPAPDYPLPLPELRKRITVEDFDFGHVTHVFELRRTRRVDSYAVTVDGKPWQIVGMSKVLEGMRKAMPRVMSERACR